MLIFEKYFTLTDLSRVYNVKEKGGLRIHCRKNEDN